MSFLYYHLSRNSLGHYTATFGKQLVRLERPLRVHHFWLAFNKRYYENNRSQVEAMWAWIGAHGHMRFVTLVEQYQAR